jgi:hypothetical protein
MKTKFLYTFAALILFAFSSLLAQESKLITGTIGKEHMVGKKLVICELGTQACMFLDIDPDLEIKVEGKKYKPEELQVGWYAQAEVETRENINQVITDLTVDPRKTIICFSNLDDKQSKALEKHLQGTKGIGLVKTYLKSRQVYIEYDPKTISYPDIENLIVRAGYKIE